MSKYEEKIANAPPSLITEVNYIENNSLSYFINQKSALNGMYLDIGSKYFVGNEDILGTNSVGMKQYNNLCGSCENEVWLVLPLAFPIATLHSVTNQRETLYCESNGGSLCFSPEETNISRLFSTIQGLSDIGAGFFQIVIAKINGVASDNIETIKKEFERTFNDDDLLNNGFVSLKPIGWRKRSLSRVSSTIPIEENKAMISSIVNKTSSFYNAILISENYTESYKGTIVKLGTLSKKFLEKIKFMYPSLDIVKVSDFEKDHFFEVTIRITQMPSYVSSEGEDFDYKDKRLSMFQSFTELNNMTSIYLGDIRLINPNKTEVDTRIPCGLFKTFALISSHSIIEKSGCYMATYIPFSHDRKKKYSKVSYNENCTDHTNINSTKINSSQILDKIQYKVSTPKILTFGDSNKETSIKTPPPSNFLSNGSNCVSNISTCDMGYNTIFNSNLGRKSYSCTPTTKASLNKISYTPFSSTEIDSSPWIGVDFNIESASIFSFEQENQQIIPPRISSINHMSNQFSNENNNHTNNQLFQSNFFSDSSFSNDIIKHIEYNHLETGKTPSDSYEVSFKKETNKFVENEIRESIFDKENNSKKNQTVDFDCRNKLIEFECPQFLEKDFDIINMLENIFSDNSATNVENCRVGCSEYFNNIESANNSKQLEENPNKTLDRKYNEDFDLWSFELYNNSNTFSGKQNSSILQKDKISEFVPSELNYLNERILFGKQLILDH